MSHNKKYALIGAISLVIGFFAGREQMKYQIMSSIAEAFGNFGKGISSTHEPAVLSSVDPNVVAAKVTAAKVKSASDDYAREYLKIYDFESSYYTGYDGKIPGVNFKIKNSGDRVVTKLCITAYFQDASGSNIAEQQYCPILPGSVFSSQPLKAGYVWQQEKGKFYQAKQVPTEWKEGAATAQISDVELSSIQ